MSRSLLACYGFQPFSISLLANKNHLLDLSQGLTHLDPLARLDQKLEVLGRLKDQDHSRSQLESSHLFTHMQRLAVQQSAHATVQQLALSTLVPILSPVRAKLLQELDKKTKILVS